MKIRRMIAGAALGLGLFAGGIMVAQNPPVEDINPKQNPNLAEAQHLIIQAYQKILAAQRGNGTDMQGHAAKAKDLLDEANRELKLAAEARDEKKR